MESAECLRAIAAIVEKMTLRLYKDAAFVLGKQPDRKMIGKCAGRSHTAASFPSSRHTRFEFLDRAAAGVIVLSPFGRSESRWQAVGNSRTAKAECHRQRRGLASAKRRPAIARRKGTRRPERQGNSCVASLTAMIAVRSVSRWRSTGSG